MPEQLQAIVLVHVGTQDYYTHDEQRYFCWEILTYFPDCIELPYDKFQPKIEYLSVKNKKYMQCNRSKVANFFQILVKENERLWVGELQTKINYNCDTGYQIFQLIANVVKCCFYLLKTAYVCIIHNCIGVHIITMPKVGLTREIFLVALTSSQ